MASRKFFSNQNGHSSNQAEGTNGYAIGQASDQKVAIPEMAFYCFDVLHKELGGFERHVEPNHLGISNSALLVPTAHIELDPFI